MQPIIHLFRSPLGGALLSYAVPQFCDGIDINVLRCCGVRGTQMGVPHEHYCNVVPLKAAPFVGLGGDAAESEDLFVPIPRTRLSFVWSIGTSAVIRISTSVGELDKPAYLPTRQWPLRVKMRSWSAAGRLSGHIDGSAIRKPNRGGRHYGLSRRMAWVAGDSGVPA
jgi:hypothetical protein